MKQKSNRNNNTARCDLGTKNVCEEDKEEVYVKQYVKFSSESPSSDFLTCGKILYYQLHLASDIH